MRATERAQYVLIAILGLALLTVPTLPAFGAIEVTGDFSPGESVWTSGGDEDDAGTIGVDSDGGLTVNNGSGLEWETFWLGEDDDATGTATFTGSGTSLDALAMFVGENGTGYLDVLNGAVADIADDTYIGYNPHSAGYMQVDGTNSALLADYFVIGDEGHGEFTLSGGAYAFANSADIGRLVNEDESSVGSGTVTVTGANSWLEVDDDITVGVAGTGSLTIEAGGSVTALNASLGNDEDAHGTVLVQGAGSSLEISETLFVGDINTGDLTIQDGGFVGVGETGGVAVIGADEDATGMVTVTGTGSELNLYENDLVIGGYGTGTLTASDGALVVARVAAIGEQEEGTGTVMVESGATWDVNFIDVGPSGTGVMTVQDGGIVTAIDSTIGHGQDGTGTLTVQGDGSSWTQTSDMVIAFNGDGTLNVLDGGHVQVGGSVGLSESGGTSMVKVEGNGSLLEMDGFLVVGWATSAGSTLEVLNGGEVNVGSNMGIAIDNFSEGSVTVRGEDSLLQVSGNLDVGNNGTGTVNVSQGGMVEAGGDIDINGQSTVNLSVGGNNMLVAGSDGPGDFINDGTVNLMAGASLAAGTFTPISVSGTFITPTGTFNGIGGTWNSSTHEFTVGEITSVVPTDLSGQRVMYGDSLVVSFGEGVGVTAFDVTELGIGEIEGETVLGAYEFDTDLEELTMLSFLIGDDLDPDSLSIWHLADGELEWELVDPSIIDYSGEYYAFSVNSFSSYAVTTTVPEPSTAALILAALGALAWRRRS